MKQLVRMLGAICLVLVVTALTSAAQGISINAEMVKDWNDLKGTMDKIAAAMPEDKFSFKSTPAQRDYGQQILHIAQVNFKILQAVGAKAPVPNIDLKATTKAGIIKAMDDSFDYGTAILKEQTDQTMLQPAAMPPGFHGAVLQGADLHVPDRPHLGHLRPDGGVPPAERRRAAGQRSSVGISAKGGFREAAPPALAAPPPRP